MDQTLRIFCLFFKIIENCYHYFLQNFLYNSSLFYLLYSGTNPISGKCSYDIWKAKSYFNNFWVSRSRTGVTTLVMGPILHADKDAIIFYQTTNLALQLQLHCTRFFRSNNRCNMHIGLAFRTSLSDMYEKFVVLKIQTFFSKSFPGKCLFQSQLFEKLQRYSQQHFEQRTAQEYQGNHHYLEEMKGNK